MHQFCYSIYVHLFLTFHIYSDYILLKASYKYFNIGILALCPCNYIHTSLTLKFLECVHCSSLFPHISSFNCDCQSHYFGVKSVFVFFNSFSGYSSYKCWFCIKGTWKSEQHITARVNVAVFFFRRIKCQICNLELEVLLVSSAVISYVGTDFVLTDIIKSQGLTATVAYEYECNIKTYIVGCHGVASALYQKQN